MTQHKVPSFRANVAAELVAHLLKWLGGHSDRITIMKLMYQVERGSLEKYDWPVTFDRLYCFPRGMVLDGVYKLMKCEIKDKNWSGYINSGTSHDLHLEKSPKLFYLSEAQLNLAKKIFEESKGKTNWDLVDESHVLPEWNDPQGSSNALDYTTVLEHLGKSDEEIKDIVAELHSEAILDELLS